MASKSEIQFVLKINSLDTLSPEDLSKLLLLLIKHEQATGGPYILSQSIRLNVKLNSHISTLFSKQGKYLTPTIQYLLSMGSLAPKKTKTIHSAKSDATPTPHRQELNAIHNTAHSVIIGQLSPELVSHVLPVFNKVIQTDQHGELSKLSSVFYAALSQSTNTNLHTSHLIDPALAGLANIYVWLAYSLYDGALDNTTYTTTSKINSIAANCIARLAESTYQKAGVNNAIVSSLFNQVDMANATELLHCQLPVENGSITITHIPSRSFLKKLLYQKSALHYAGPLAIAKAEQSGNGRQKSILSTLNSYCSARQLADDIHDWEDDIRSGRITYAVAVLMRMAKIQPGNHSVENLVKKLKKVYWEFGLEHLLNESTEMAQSAESGYIEVFGFIPRSVFHTLTTAPIIRANEKALAQLNYDKQFLKIAARLP